MIVSENKRTNAVLSLLQEFPGFDKWFDSLEVLESVELQVAMDELMEADSANASRED